jgi:hypothetical protein
MTEDGAFEWLDQHNMVRRTPQLRKPVRRALRQLMDRIHGTDR